MCEYESMHRVYVGPITDSHIINEKQKKVLNIDIRCQSNQTFHHRRGKISWTVCTCEYFQASLIFVGKAMSPLLVYSVYFIHVQNVNGKETIYQRYKLFLRHCR
jgi:hypothetical protein